MAPIIEARGLTKTFGQTHALAGVDLTAETGRVTALLGPNGAGKTTFVRAVATLVRPTGGTLTVGGYDVVRAPAEVRKIIGLAGQFAAVEPTMSGRENLEMVGRLFGLRRSETRAAATAVLAQISLTDDADRLVRTYSGGMRRRLDLGASLVGRPRLLILDEPTTGLDPRSRLELWEAIRGLVSQGTDVLLTSQYLDEADHLADDIVVIDRGRVVAAGTPAELKSGLGKDVIEVHPRDGADLALIAGALTGLGGEPLIDATTRRVSVTVDHGTDRLMDAVRSVDRLGVDIDDLGLRRPTLDEVFLALTTATPATTSSAA
jgi:ABC-2 type transport system ATP-binding protein